MSLIGRHPIVWRIPGELERPAGGRGNAGRIPGWCSRTIWAPRWTRGTSGRCSNGSATRPRSGTAGHRASCGPPSRREPAQASRRSPVTRPPGCTGDGHPSDLAGHHALRPFVGVVTSSDRPLFAFIEVGRKGCRGARSAGYACTLLTYAWPGPTCQATDPSFSPAALPRPREPTTTISAVPLS